MDPVTATGLAASVVTFVQFAWELFASGHAIYRSRDGLPRNKTSVDSVAGDLNRLGKGILDNTTEKASEDLKILAKTCTDIADELCSALKKLKANGKRSRWACLRIALKDLWKSGEIDDIQNRLDNVRAQLHVRLTADISMQCGKLASMDQELQVNLSGKVQESEQNILKALQTLDLKISGLSSGMPHQNPAVNQEAAGGLIQLTTQRNIKTGSGGIGSNDIDKEAPRFLESLHFRSEEVRHAQIPVAHEKTFRWIFKAKASPFYKWLRGSDGIFWISGKAGSGKSTLMKLISDDPRTQELLQKWSGSKKLVLAKHFFWKPGVELQKSREGLLRSLLYQVLKLCPELIPAVLEVLPHQYSNTSWYLHELLDIFASLSRTAPASIRLCLIIDGLDEYESSKGYQIEELIKVIQTLSRQNWVKVCVSSRPWNNFQDAFGSDQDYWLKLEDLTRKDIKAYVQNKLQGKLDLGSSRHTSDHKLFQKVIEKAQGVFLWVYLAVCDLLQGIQDGDRLNELLRKVDNFSPDLKEFLQSILDSIDPVHQEEAAKHFKITLSLLDVPQDCNFACPLLIHTFVGEIEDLENFDDFLSLSKWDEEAFKTRLDNGRRRLLSRCKGLLETTKDYESFYTYSEWPYGPPTVHFFHSAVVELISDMFISKLENFEPGAFMCKAYRILFDIAYPKINNKPGENILCPEDLIELAMSTSEKLGQPSKKMIHWIKQADSITEQRLDYADFYSVPSPPYDCSKMLFLKTCVFKGFSFYVHSTLMEHPHPSQLSLQLLHAFNHWNRKTYFLSKYEHGMRNLFLEKLGAIDVKLSCCPYCSGSSSRSIWACYLTFLRRRALSIRRLVPTERDGWVLILGMYLQRCENALDHIVPYDEDPEFADFTNENPRDGLPARTIIQRYLPDDFLQKIGIESLPSDAQRDGAPWF